MSDIAIKVENLSKMYRLGDIGTGSLGTDITSWWAKMRGKDDPFSKIAIANDRSKKATTDFVWSLNNIDFEIKKGDAVGIIGRNGAGKSTLLKILARTTTPTTGSVKINGRVASLLEVGTGFHPDLSGKENVFMNGAILGMSRSEISSKMEQIIEFSGVSGYIDTPVKRYSSGMYVRLAFAVAAHLDPEILIIDEVLAVGDSEFQKKCLNRMKDASTNEGRTVIFVSHNMAAMQALCNKAILLINGEQKVYDTTDVVMRNYIKSLRENNKIDVSKRTDRSGNGMLKLDNVLFLNDLGELVSSIMTGQALTIVLKIIKLYSGELKNVCISLGIDDEQGIRITHFNNIVTDQVIPQIDQSEYSVKIFIPKLPIMPGKYDFAFFCSSNGEICDWLQNAFQLDIEEGDYFGTGKLVPQGQGSFLTDHKFLDI